MTPAQSHANSERDPPNWPTKKLHTLAVIEQIIAARKKKNLTSLDLFVAPLPGVVKQRWSIFYKQNNAAL